MDELRIVLLGRTGAGKSTSGNNILDTNVFHSSASGISVTRHSQRGTATRYGKQLEVIDTPGLFDTDISQESVLQEIVKCVALTAPGPHAFVLVLRLDRYTDEENKCIENFKRAFGHEMMKYLLILFTRKDDLIYDDKTVEEYLSTAPSKLKMLVESCNNRYIAFNNRGTDDERSKDTESFLRLIQDMIKKNGSCYTSEMYEEAERVMKKRAEQIQREAKEKAAHLRREIEEDYLNKVKMMQATETEKTSPLLAKIQELEQQATQDSKQLMELKSELQNLKCHMKEAQEEAAETKKLEERKILEMQAMTTRESRLLARDEVSDTLDDVMSMLKSVVQPILRACVEVVVDAVKDHFDDQSTRERETKSTSKKDHWRKNYN